MGIVGETIREISLKVSQYFLDFLESDFKRQQAPRRRVVLQTESGFRSAMRVATYPALQHNLWQIIGKRSDGDPTLKVAPRTYPRPISNTLRLIIKEQIQVVADDELVKVRAAVFSQAEDSRSLAIENPEEWVDLVRTTLAAEIGTHIVAPLLALLDGPLSQQSYSVHDSIYAAESELIEILASRLDVILPEVLSRYLASGEQAEFLAVLESYLALEDVQAEMLAYFESFMAADAFLEFRDLDTYAMTGEGLQLYLYIGQLKFGGHGYACLARMRTRQRSGQDPTPVRVVVAATDVVGDRTLFEADCRTPRQMQFWAHLFKASLGRCSLRSIEIDNISKALRH